MFCPNCKKETEAITIFVKGEEVNHCAYCGNTISTTAPDFSSKNFAILNRVLVAEDSRLLQEISRDAILEHKIAKDVVVCSHGGEMVESYAKALRERKPFNLMVVDINMPVLGGLSASVAIRAMERGLHISPPVPILFFTVSQLTEEMRRFFLLVKPAVYLYKGEVAEPERLATRLVKGIFKLYQQTGKKSP